MLSATSPATSGLEEILALSELISKAAAEIANSGHLIPSLHSTERGPFDTPENTPAEISAAIRTIEAACAQLSYTVASPGHVVANKGYGIQEPVCMLVAADAKIADLLLDKPEGMHIDQLARKTGINRSKLARVLRFLATKHCFTEVKPDVFANNRLSMKLLSRDPVSHFVSFIADEGVMAATALNDTLKDPVETSSNLPGGSAFTRAYGSDVFVYMSAPEQHQRITHFGKAMVAWGDVTGRAMLPKVYPWASLPADTLICDVGGGNGHASINLLKAFPHLKFVVQDLPGVVEQAPAFFDQEVTNPALKGRLEYVSLDFFNEAPVRDADFYYLRHILHDWPNPACQTILDGIRSSMKPSSRLLVHEFVLQHVVASDHTFDRAPEPLLPNYGVGSVRAYTQDITMMIMHNSKERTLQEYIEMGARSGLRFVKVWAQGEVGLVEFEVMGAEESSN
ncbi:S-adenosyl-L-methionine-dependent methyltransferase [Mycena galericulata]|nr:S-adenosyl-L-methionine-dependent methyltransferase [Mycena galericulata]